MKNLMQELLAESSLSEAKAIEVFTIHNMAGVPKKFRQVDGDWENRTAALAWMKSRDYPEDKAEARRQKQRDAEFDKLDRKEAREAAKKPWVRVKLDLNIVYHKVIDSVGNSFPDGDPIDTLIPWLERKGLKGYEVGETIEAAMKKHGHGIEKKGMYAYMGEMWDSMSDDALHDAETLHKQGRESDSPLIDYDKDGKPEKKSNPWK